MRIGAVYDVEQVRNSAWVEGTIKHNGITINAWSGAGLIGDYKYRSAVYAYGGDNSWACPAWIYKCIVTVTSSTPPEQDSTHWRFVGVDDYYKPFDSYSGSRLIAASPVVLEIRADGCNYVGLYGIDADAVNVTHWECHAGISFGNLDPGWTVPAGWTWTVSTCFVQVVQASGSSTMYFTPPAGMTGGEVMELWYDPISGSGTGNLKFMAGGGMSAALLKTGPITTISAVAGTGTTCGFVATGQITQSLYVYQIKMRRDYRPNVDVTGRRIYTGIFASSYPVATVEVQAARLPGNTDPVEVEFFRVADAVDISARSVQKGVKAALVNGGYYRDMGEFTELVAGPVNYSIDASVKVASDDTDTVARVIQDAADGLCIVDMNSPLTNYDSLRTIGYIDSASLDYAPDGGAYGDLDISIRPMS